MRYLHLSGECGGQFQGYDHDWYITPVHIPVGFQRFDDEVPDVPRDSDHLSRAGFLAEMTQRPGDVLLEHSDTLGGVQ